MGQISLIRCLFVIAVIFSTQPFSYANDLFVANVIISDVDKSANTKEEKLTAPAIPATEAPVAVQEEQAPAEIESRPSVVKGLKSKQIKAERTTKYNLKQSSQDVAKKPRQFELHGYVNNKYVYLVVEKVKANDQQVVGYMFDGKGNKKYVYGEWVNKTLQVYEPSNKRSTVLLNDNPSQSTSNSPFGSDKQMIEQHGSVK